MATGTAPIFQAAISATKCSRQLGRQTATGSPWTSPSSCNDAASRPVRWSSSSQLRDRSRPLASTSETAGSAPRVLASSVTRPPYVMLTARPYSCHHAPPPELDGTTPYAVSGRRSGPPGPGEEQAGPCRASSSWCSSRRGIRRPAERSSGTTPHRRPAAQRHSRLPRSPRSPSRSLRSQ